MHRGLVERINTLPNGLIIIAIFHVLKRVFQRFDANAFVTSHSLTAVDGGTVIEKGVAAGESVVTDGHLRLTPGARVSERGAQRGGTGQGGGAGGTGQGGYSLTWDKPDASKGRAVLSSVKPKIPQWVSAQGLTMRVTVAFTLQPDGVVSAVSVERSSGYADVDSAVIEAVRQWRFTAASGGGPVKGVISHLINTR